MIRFDWWGKRYHSGLFSVDVRAGRWFLSAGFYVPWYSVGVGVRWERN